GLDLLADRDHFLGVIDPPARAELADVDQPLDAGRDLDERAERLEPSDRALDPGALGEVRGRIAPRIAGQYLERQGDAIALDLEHGDVELLAEPEHVLRLVDARVAELGDVQHALDAAEVDERAERLEADDLATQHGAGRQLLAGLDRALFVILFEQR